MRNQPSLILASASPRRRELLARLGIPFGISPSEIPELPLPAETPEQLTRRLARGKATTVAARLDRDRDEFPLVIGADSVVVYQGRILGKPRSPADAVATLRRLRARTHRVVTSVAVIDPRTGESSVGTEMSRVRLRPLSDNEILAYVASGDPLDKAGSYAIQNAEFHPAESLTGCYSNVVGLPLCRLAKQLHYFGVELAAIWFSEPGGCHCASLVADRPIRG